MNFKIFLYTLALMLSLFSVSALPTQVINDCSSLPNNNTHYILSDTFTKISDNCVNFDSVSNVIFDGDNNYFNTDFTFRYNNANNITIQNLYANALETYKADLYSPTVNGFTLRNSIFLDQQEPFFSGIRILGERHNQIWYNLVIEDVFMKTTQNIPFGNVEASYWTTGGNSYNIYNLTMTNVDLIGFNNFLEGQDTNSGATSSGYLYDNVQIDNVNFMTNAFDMGLSTGVNCGNSYVTNSLLGFIAFLDNNENFLSDSAYTYTDTCTYISGAQKTMNTINMPVTNTILGEDVFDQEYKEYSAKTYFVNAVPQTTDYFNSNSKYVYTTFNPINSTHIINFQGAVNSVLELTKGSIATIYAPRGLRMGHDNTIYGGDDTTTKPQINSAGSISISYSGNPYENTWQLIDYYNMLTIDNIDFNMNAVDNYGLIRKSNSAIDGIDFIMRNSIFDLNFVPNNPERPQILIGAFSTFEDNTFDLLGTVNVTLLGGGLSESIGGGHTIIGNSFNGGGYIFSGFTESLIGTNYQNIIVNNEFTKVGSLYAFPFHPTDNSKNFLSNVHLNGSYFYKTACDSLEFNIGNYYQDWDDNGWYNDSDSDGIHNTYLGIPYIDRGTDYLNNSIRDYRSIVSFPYDFAGNTGTAINSYDLCAPFSFNIISPENITYSSGSDIISNWEFVSVTYPDMVCFEYLADSVVIYESVSSGDNQGKEYDVTDGRGTFKVKCCDDISCNNVIEESEIIEFCVGNCDSDLAVIGITEPVIVYGCTDSNANNYNPSATNDNGSCTYDEDVTPIEEGGSISFGDIFSNDVTESSQSVTSLFKLAQTPMGYLIIIGFALMFLSIIGLLFAVARGMFS